MIHLNYFILLRFPSYEIVIRNLGVGINFNLLAALILH